MMKAKAPAPRLRKPLTPPSRPGVPLSSNPRLTAFQVLKEVQEGRSPEESLTSRGLLLTDKDLTLTTALVYETLRHQGYLDWLLKIRLSAGRASADLALVLRLGLVQILFFDRLGDHAVVSETVTLAKISTPGRQGLVNAVLRGLLRDREAGLPWPPAPPAGQTDKVTELAIAHSYQPWFVKKMLSLLGPDEAEALLIAGNQATPPTIRINPGRTDRQTLGRLLSFPTAPTALSPWGLKIDRFVGRPEKWSGFDEGLFAIQDEASQLIGLLASPLKEGGTVLDACSGLGGKALHLASLYPTANITASDKDPGRLERLLTESRRLLGGGQLKIETGDLLTRRPDPARVYDLVLVDAPCSGLGVVRRRPDLKWNKTEADLPRLAELQGRMLAAAAQAVKSGGSLIYGVCTFSQEEGPGVVRKFIADCPDFRAARPEEWPEALRPHLAEPGHLTLWPHRHQTDGFFWAKFIKKMGT